MAFLKVLYQAIIYYSCYDPVSRSRSLYQGIIIMIQDESRYKSTEKLVMTRIKSHFRGGSEKTFMTNKPIYNSFKVTQNSVIKSSWL